MFFNYKISIIHLSCVLLAGLSCFGQKPEKKPISFVNCITGQGGSVSPEYPHGSSNMSYIKKIILFQVGKCNSYCVCIVHSIRNTKDLDEAPGAYKNIDVVMENQSDLVDILEELSPLAVIKG